MCQKNSENMDMVNKLVRNGSIKHQRVANVMSEVDRGNYAPMNPYQDSPQIIGFEATISAPHMHAMMLDIAANYISDGSHVLDIGSGSGYLLACFGLMVGKTGKVIGLEINKELAHQSKWNLYTDQPQLLSTDVINVMTGDGRNGCSQGSPFDVIHVGVAMKTVSNALLSNVKLPGVIIVPIEGSDGVQWLTVIALDQTGATSTYEICRVRFVSLQ